MTLEIRVLDMQDHFERVDLICSPLGERVVSRICEDTDDWASNAVWAQGTIINDEGVGPIFEEGSDIMNQIRLFCVLTLLSCERNMFDGIFAETEGRADNGNDEDLCP